MLEAVLVHVVAQAEHQRGVDLGLRRPAAAPRGPPGARGRVAGRPASSRASVSHLRLRAPRRGGRRRASRRRARVAAPAGRRRRPAAPPRTAARARPPRPRGRRRASGRRRPARPGRRPARRTPPRRRLSRARWLDHPLALGALAGVVGRGGDVDDHRRAGQRLVGGGGPGLPDVLADRDAEPHAVELDDRRRPGPTGSSAARRTRRSWAGTPCGRSPAPRRRRAPRRSCRRPTSRSGKPTIATMSRRSPRPAGRTRRAGVAQEVLLEQQVLGRIAGDRQLGEHDELRAGLARARERVDGLAPRCRRCRRRSG